MTKENEIPKRRESITVGSGSETPTEERVYQIPKRREVPRRQAPRMELPPIQPKSGRAKPVFESLNPSQAEENLKYRTESLTDSRPDSRSETVSRHGGADGLRVFALLGVAAFHIRPDIMPGGFLGVVIFLVLAGFYTTRSFVVRPKVDLFGYYKKRISRLWPSLLFLLLVLALVTGFFLPEVFSFFKESAPTAALGIHNIAEILADNSYFARHGSFDPLTHLWALSLEMQFYLFFPLIYAALSWIGDQMPKRIRIYSREIAGVIFLILGLVSAAYMGIKYQPEGDPTPYYYNSLMRANAFLNGAAICLITAGRQMRHALKRGQNRNSGEELPKSGIPLTVRSIVGWLCLILLVASFFVFDSSSQFLYQGGFYVYGLLACLYLLFGGVKPVAGMGFMETAPVRYLASRSYQIYLWQYALMILIEAVFRFSTIGFWPKLGIQMALLFLISEIAWRIFEKPGVRTSFRNLLAAIMAILLTIILALPAPAKSQAPELEGDAVLRAIQENEAKQAKLWEEESKEKEEENKKAKADKKDSKKNSKKNKDDKGKDDAKDKTKETVKEIDNWSALTAIDSSLISKDNPYGYSDDARAVLKDLNLVVIGDSVMAMAMDGLRTYVPNVYIDAAVSRHMFQGPGLIEDLDNAGYRGDVLVVALSTNGDINPTDLDRLHTIANGRPLILVNTVVPQSWEQPNNNTLSRFASGKNNVYIADWYSRAKSTPKYFYQDATHPVPEGAAVYDEVILNTVLQALSTGKVERNAPITFPPAPTHTSPKSEDDAAPEVPEVPAEPTPVIPENPKPATPEDPVPQPEEPAPEIPAEPAPEIPAEPAPVTPVEPAPEAPEEPAPVAPEQPVPKEPEPQQPAPETPAPEQPAPATPNVPQQPKPENPDPAEGGPGLPPPVPPLP